MESKVLDSRIPLRLIETKLHVNKATFGLRTRKDILAGARVSVEISSEPPGADIYVDGKFDSSTPAKLLLSPGEHTIKIARLGFKGWERKIFVEPGAVKTLNAILERTSP